MLIAGVGGFRRPDAPANPSARLLRSWLDRRTFIWLVTEEILDEYREVLARRGVRRTLVGQIINLLREEAEVVRVRGAVQAEPDPEDAEFWACARFGDADFVVTLNTRDFPVVGLGVPVIEPGGALPAPKRRPRSTRRPRARPKRPVRRK